MPALSDYLSSAILAQLLRGTTWTPPASIYAALTTVTVTHGMTGSSITEPSGGSYARVAINPGTGTWAAVSGFPEASSNVSTLTWPTSTGSWGTITGVALCDASSSGNLLAFSSLGSSVAVGSGGVFSINAGNLVFSLT